MADAVGREQGETDLADTVATHYNKIQAGSVSQRVESRIFYLRNFNNWVKSILINDAIYILKRQGQDPRTMNVLDLASGKGGDQLKWKKAGVKHVVFADIAEISMDHCRSRFLDSKNRRRFEREASQAWPMFTAEFHVADCTKVRLRDKYEEPGIAFDLVSCQFSLHYAFESMSKARRMLQNAAENLRPGGLFIGTIPDAYEVVRRAREAALSASPDAPVNGFGNSIYRVAFEKPVTATDLMRGNSFPLFGARYHFSLEGVVDCPEFLVYFPLLEELARSYGLRLRSCLPFADFFAKSVARNDGRALIGRMQALEPFPAQEGVALMGGSGAYASAEQWLREAGDGRTRTVGTLSAEEWEAASFYLTFIFEKEEARAAAERPEEARSAEGESAQKRQRLEQ